MLPDVSATGILFFFFSLSLKACLRERAQQFCHLLRSQDSGSAAVILVWNVPFYFGARPLGGLWATMVTGPLTREADDWLGSDDSNAGRDIFEANVSTFRQGGERILSNKQNPPLCFPSETRAKTFFCWECPRLNLKSIKRSNDAKL